MWKLKLVEGRLDERYFIVVGGSDMDGDRRAVSIDDVDDLGSENEPL